MAFSRRTFLQRGTMLAAGSAAWPSWMPRMVFRDQQSAPGSDVLVVVFARGGFDGLNMVIPYLDEGYYFGERPTVAIPAPDSTATNRAYDLDGDFGMHPVLAGPDAGRWKEHFDNGILGIVHAVHQDDPTRSHFDAMDFMERGTPGEKRLMSGWLGRHLAAMKTNNTSPFRAVGMGTMLQASLRGSVPAVTLRSIADFHLHGREDEVGRFQQHLERLYSGDGWLEGQGEQTFAALEMLEQAVGDGSYTPENGAAYGNDNFSRGLMQIAQLVKADLGLEVACIDIGGWDTHANQVSPDDPTTGNMANLLRNLSRGITAFIDDLRDHFDPREAENNQGVTILVMSEFGRRAFENGNLGTDHGHGNAMFAFGRGVNGGKVYGRWPGLAPEFRDRGDLAGTTEYRDILAEILAKRVGNDKLTEVFPGHTFNYLGLATALAGTPTGPTPGPEPTDPPPVEVPDNTIYMPYGVTGR